MNMTSSMLYTIGHSNHELPRFVELLERHQITAIADVRSRPYSQYSPQFNREALIPALAAHKIGYVFMGDELGARRSEAECYVDGKAVYDRVASLPAFQHGLERIRQGVAKRRIALMCSEKDPITCHRTILICRRLQDGLDIRHILESGELESHSALEARLLALHDFTEGDLFHTKEQLVQQAYDRQGDEIAFVEDCAAANVQLQDR
jgi:uncharacterized protein (DUF488 family)